MRAAHMIIRLDSHHSRILELYSKALGTEDGDLCSLTLDSENHGSFEVNYRILENHGILEP